MMMAEKTDEEGGRSGKKEGSSGKKQRDAASGEKSSGTGKKKRPRSAGGSDDGGKMAAAQNIMMDQLLDYGDEESPGGADRDEEPLDNDELQMYEQYLKRDQEERELEEAAAAA